MPPRRRTARTGAWSQLLRDGERPPKARDGRLAPDTRIVEQLEISARRPGDLATDGEAEAGPLFLALGREERLEQPVAQGLRDTRAVVGDLDDGEARIFGEDTGADLNDGLGDAGDGVERVRDQID